MNAHCSLRSIMRRRHIRSLTEARGIKIVIPKKDVIIAAQEKRITRLIYNLLLNAIQNSGVSHRVEVLLEMKNDGCMVEIQDHGERNSYGAYR